ncbi:MAG: hypothetical protein HWE07_14665 [Cytophagia bacterium]|nr:hypothetical protein [Cytophagia bacterium]
MDLLYPEKVSMIDLFTFKTLEIEREEIRRALAEKEQLRKKVLVFFGIFLITILIMVPLQESFEKTRITEIEFKSIKVFLKLGGILFWAGIFMIFRIFSLNKEINLKKEHYRKSIREASYLIN